MRARARCVLGVHSLRAIGARGRRKGRERIRELSGMPWPENYSLKRTEIADKSTFDRAVSREGRSRLRLSRVQRVPPVGCACTASARGVGAACVGPPRRRQDECATTV